MADDVLDRLKAVVAEFFGTPIEKLRAESTADDVDGWDSVAHAMLVLEIEDVFGIQLEYGEALEAENLEAFSVLIASKAGGGK